MSALIYQSVKVRSGTIGFVTCGVGEPLVLITGYSGTLFHWNKYFIDQLSQKYQLYLLDNRFIGKSDTNNANTTTGMAQDAYDFIEALSLKNPILLGWSMGGTIVQELALLCGDNLGGILLLATVPGNLYISFSFISFMSTIGNISVDEYRRKLYQFFFANDDMESNISLVKNTALNISDYDYRFNQKALDLQYHVIATWGGINEQQLSLFKVPVLLFYARDDYVVLPTANEYFVAHIPDSSLIEYETGGHVLIHSNFESIVSSIKSCF